ncbi:hypothetical protein FHW23_001236 [Curtobacterium pusillum]|uniref:Uncharacterized protein n=1 Tax=Curtobacterium pusillum TaxID=69373 RepID=A0AAW3T4Y7_9MICO|nr:hypothetical protein [Curtobacterium pusillum]
MPEPVVVLVGGWEHRRVVDPYDERQRRPAR